MDSYFVSRAGTWDLILGGRSGTPVLSIENQKAGNILRVSTNFMGISNGRGFYYKINSVDPADTQALSPIEAVFQNDPAGWNACVRTAYFQMQNDGNVTFEVMFFESDLGGSGRLYNFLLESQIVQSR